MPTPETPSPEQLHILLARARREGLDATVIDRLTVILHFAENTHSISETCRRFCISRSTFHRWMERFDPENLSSLADKSHEPLTLRQSTIDAETVEIIRRYRMQHLQMGKGRIAELLLTEHGKDISPSSVGRIIERECLYFADTPFHWKKRLENQGVSNVPGAASESRSLGVGGWPRLPEEVSTHITVESESVDDSDDMPRVVPVRRFRWQSVKRLIIVSSVITNIAFVSLLLGNVFIEHVSKPAPSDVALETLHAAPANDLP